MSRPELREPVTSAHGGLRERLDPALPDRPGWVPDHIQEGWDPDPYAYQTEEELMPAGGLHGQLLTYITEVLRVHLEGRRQMLLVDAFVLYRDARGVKQRVGPDLLLMEYAYPPPAAYDLDVRPVPRCIIEITSPDSHVKDLRSNVPLYLGLGTESYLVIDAVTPSQKLRDPVELHLWRQAGGQAGGKVPGKVLPDAPGYLLLPEMDLKVGAFGQRLVFVDTATGLVLPDSGELRQALALEARRADVEARRAEIAEQQAKSAFSAGEKEQAVKIARRMLAGGLGTAAIEEFTGLSPADLAAIDRERGP